MLSHVVITIIAKLGQSMTLSRSHHATKSSSHRMVENVRRALGDERSKLIKNHARTAWRLDPAQRPQAAQEWRHAVVECEISELRQTPEKEEQTYWQSARREKIGFGMSTPDKAETRLRARYGC